MTQKKQVTDRAALTVDGPGSIEIIDEDGRPSWRDTVRPKLAEEDTTPRRVYVLRPPRDEPGLTELFDGAYNLNDYLNEFAAILTRKAKYPKEPPEDFRKLIKGPLDPAKFPAEASRFNALIDKALAEIGATRGEYAGEIGKINQVFLYFFVLAELDEAGAVDQVQARLTLYKDAQRITENIRAALADVLGNDPEAPALIKQIAPKYRAYKLAELLEEATKDPDLFLDLARNYRTGTDLVRAIETDADELGEVARDPSALSVPERIPRLFVQEVAAWNNPSRPGITPNEEYYRGMASAVVDGLKTQWREMLEDAEQFGPERLDDAAANLGFIDLMSMAKEWTTVKAHYAKLRPPRGTYRRVYSSATPAGMSDIIASNSWIYRRAGILTLDNWQPNRPVMLIQQNDKDLNENVSWKYFPRPWDSFITAVYDAIASIYFNSDQWKHRTTDYVIVNISFYVLREVVAPRYFYLIAEKTGKKYEPPTLSIGQDDSALMADIREAVNVLMETVVNIHHSETLKKNFRDDRDGVLSGMEQDLNALYAVYSRFEARNGEDVEGITVLAPPILPYDCMRMKQTVEIPRKDYFTTAEYAHYLKDQYGIESVSLADFDGGKYPKAFVVMRNNNLSVKVKLAVVRAYEVFKAEVEKNGLKTAIDKGLNVFYWERNLYPAVFCTVTAPAWEKDEPRPQAEAVDYKAIPKKQRIYAKKLALAAVNNLSIKPDGMAYEVLGVTKRDKYGVGVRFKPASKPANTPPAHPPEPHQASLTEYH